jgi:hypothetical protein
MAGSELANVIQLPTEYEPVDISPLDALLGEVKRTAGKIAWLEKIVAALSISEMFGDDETIEQYEGSRSRMGAPQGDSPTARVKWLLANEGERKQTQIRKRPGIHPAITNLMAERKHLVDTCSRALTLGIKLDHIELTQRQGEQMLAGMLAFAELSGLNLDDDRVKSNLASAIGRVATNAK